MMKNGPWEYPANRRRLRPLPLCGANISESRTAKMMARSVRFMQEASIDTANHCFAPEQPRQVDDSQPIEKTIPITASSSNMNGQTRAAAIIPPPYLYLRKASLSTGSQHHRITPTAM